MFPRIRIIMRIYFYLCCYAIHIKVYILWTWPHMVQNITKIKIITNKYLYIIMHIYKFIFLFFPIYIIYVYKTNYLAGDHHMHDIIYQQNRKQHVDWFVYWNIFRIWLSMINFFSVYKFGDFANLLFLYIFMYLCIWTHMSFMMPETLFVFRCNCVSECVLMAGNRESIFCVFFIIFFMLCCLNRIVNIQRLNLYMLRADFLQ